MSTFDTQYEKALTKPHIRLPISFKVVSLAANEGYDDGMPDNHSVTVQYIKHPAPLPSYSRPAAAGPNVCGTARGKMCEEVPVMLSIQVTPEQFSTLRIGMVFDLTEGFGPGLTKSESLVTTLTRGR